MWNVEHTPDAGRWQLPWRLPWACDSPFLILWGVNKVHPGLKGSVHILSVCLSMLNKVENLPPYRSPTQCSHSDVLKTIMVNCIDLSFLSDFSFMRTTTWVEPLCIFLGKTNSTSDKGDMLCFWVQKQLAHARFQMMQIVCTTSSSLILFTGSWHTWPSVGSVVCFILLDIDR